LKKFLEKVAGSILNDVGKDCLHTAVILPNKRSEVFLKDHLKNLATEDFWLPEMYSIDEFMVKASGLAEQDQVNLYFELFDIHRRIAGTEARSIDDFLAWAPVMLSDFNDIDLYLADPEKIFTHLSEVKAMEAWNPDGRPLTPLQQNYLSFFRSLEQYYRLLHRRMADEGAGYKGMVYRYLFENIEKLSQGWPWKRFVLVGFNALSDAEKKVFGFIHKNFQTNIFWDLDEYYFHAKQPYRHEAGRFINELITEWKIKPANVHWVTHHLMTDKDKEITILGVPKKIGQVKFAGQQIEKWFEADENGEGNSYSDTAIVLADENLLIPLLNSLPKLKIHDDKLVGYNVTMGYPLANSAYTDFANRWLELLIQSEEHVNHKYSVFHLLALVNNPVFQLILEKLLNGKPGLLTERITSFNSVYLDFGQIISVMEPKGKPVNDLMQNLLKAGKSSSSFIMAFITFLKNSKQVIGDSGHGDFLLSGQLAMTMNLIKRLDILLQKNGEDLNLKGLQNIFNQLVRRTGINLKGEPLHGIQVMGMLETRNLDFKNIILLSANDGILPKTNNMESFIPFDIRSHYGLPLPKDKSDVYSYHFYRLLQRAQKTVIVYDSEPGNLGGGEKSRLILQIQNEMKRINENLNIDEKTLAIPFDDSKTGEQFVISKSPDIINTVRDKLKAGISPSALSAYISCPLKFYFRYVLNLAAEESIEESIEADVFGTVVHKVLQEMYEGLAGKPITKEYLESKLRDIDRLLLKWFKEKYPGGDLDSGKNLLILKVAGKYVRQFLTKEIEELKRQPRVLVAAEEKLSYPVETGKEKILIHGIVDRSDKITGTDRIRIVDYKTGNVVPGDLKLKEWDTLITGSGKAKAFQVLFYAYLFAKTHPNIKDIEAGIYSLRKISQGFIKLHLPESVSLVESFGEFEQQLTILIRDILDTSKPFIQTADEKECSWCDFKDICNRQGDKN